VREIKRRLSALISSMSGWTHSTSASGCGPLTLSRSDTSVRLFLDWVGPSCQPSRAGAEAVAAEDIAASSPVEIWFQDEMRVDQKNGLVYQWAAKGTRPRTSRRFDPLRDPRRQRESMRPIAQPCPRRVYYSSGKRGIHVFTQLRRGGIRGAMNPLPPEVASTSISTKCRLAVYSRNSALLA
jgi:hypothetical protein